jgi:hypothetical protein
MTHHQQHMQLRSLGRPESGVRGQNARMETASKAAEVAKVPLSGKKMGSRDERFVYRPAAQIHGWGMPQIYAVIPSIS